MNNTLRLFAAASLGLLLGCGGSTPAKPAIASFAAAPANVESGASSTLSWSVTGADSLSIDNGVGVVTGNSRVVTPAATTTYTLSASSSSGTVTAIATVTVSTPAKPTITAFSANPATIAGGSASTLTWSVSGAQSLAIDQGVGTVTGTSTSVSPAVTTTYTLTATAPGGATSTAKATVAVTAAGGPTISAFTATPPGILAGASSTLAFTVTGATSLSIDHGVGTVAGTSVSVSPITTTLYTLTATGASGTSTASVTVNVTTPAAAPVISAFSASPASIANGSASLLSWTVSDAATLTIDNGIGAVTGSSSLSVSPAVTTTYKLTASNSLGTVSAAATVEVTGSPAIVSLTAAPSSIALGGSATLSWTVARATSVSLDNGIGAVTGTSRSVSPATTTTYTLTASGTGAPATASVTVHVLHLAYANPVSGGLVRVIGNAASTPTHLVLDVVVGASPSSAFGLQMNLKVDPTRVTFDAATGLDVSASQLTPTANSQTAAKALLRTDGPLAGTLVLGVAHRKTAPADLDQSLAPGALLARLAFDLAPGATAGPILDSSRSFGVLLSGTLAPVVAPPDFAIGTLAVAE